MKKTKLLLMMLLFVATAFASQKRKVLIIGLDGLRSDAFQLANTPKLDSLVATGTYTWDAWHLGITVSGPSWSTIMTGVWHPKHGVTNNSYTGSKFNDYPYITKLAKTFKPNLKCTQVIEWPPLVDNIYNDEFDVELKTPDGDGAATSSVAKQQLLTDADLDFMFVYFDIIDITGHSSGFSPQNPSYMQAIETTDGHVGIVLDALRARPTYADEDWLVLVITDHGGVGTGHGGNSFVERHIWWIASGTAVQKQQIFAPDPGSYMLAGGVNDSLLKLSPVQADIGVTALHHLLFDIGINPEEQAAWNLDGKSWLSAFTSIDEKQQEEGNAKVYPNPTTGMLTVWIENPYQNNINYTVTDMLGRTVRSIKDLSLAGNKFNIDLAGEPCANYVLNIEVGKQRITKNISLQY